MIRLILTYLVPLVLPALGWYLWRLFAPHARGRPGPKAAMAEAPWPWLGGAGVLLLGLTLGAFALLTGGSPGDVYQPPQLVDGEVVPGRHDPGKRDGI